MKFFNDLVAFFLGPRPRKLRCKPGDFALITYAGFKHDPSPLDALLEGYIVQVDHAFPHAVSGEPCWSLQGGPVSVKWGNYICTFNGILDDILRPLGSPDDSAEDEMVLRRAEAPWADTQPHDPTDDSDTVEPRPDSA